MAPPRNIVNWMERTYQGLGSTTYVTVFILTFTPVYKTFKEWLQACCDWISEDKGLRPGEDQDGIPRVSRVAASVFRSARLHGSFVRFPPTYTTTAKSLNRRTAHFSGDHSFDRDRTKCLQLTEHAASSTGTRRLSWSCRARARTKRSRW